MTDNFPSVVGDVLAARRASVVAPAGCGKTHLIAQCALAHAGKPALILTHTNAGVASLRGKLTQLGIPSTTFRLHTIDGFALHAVRNFPDRSGFRVRLECPLGDQYAGIRDGCARLLSTGAITDLVLATYGRVFVDEYQDCTSSQHAIALSLAEVLPTCVFGDPLQAVFGFNEPLPEWTDVQSWFPTVGTLDRPWRWLNANSEGFGNWLLSLRAAISTNAAFDLPESSPWVRWKPLDTDPGANRQNQVNSCLQTPHGGSLVVIADAKKPSAKHDFASRCTGIVVCEPVDLPDLGRYARLLDATEAEKLGPALDLAAEMMTGISRSNLIKRVRTLQEGSAHKAATAVEASAVAVAKGGGLGTVLTMLCQLRNSKGTRMYRHHLYAAVTESLQLAVAEGVALHDAAVRVRELYRRRGRTMPRRCIGSVLLLKGLEADHAVILDADAMKPFDLYVALTRASRSVTVFSKSRTLRG